MGQRSRAILGARHDSSHRVGDTNTSEDMSPSMRRRQCRRRSLPKPGRHKPHISLIREYQRPCTSRRGLPHGPL